MAGRMALPARRRALLGILLALVLAFSPGCAATAVALAPSSANSAVGGPELHEDLRPARDLPRPSTPRPERPRTASVTAAPARYTSCTGAGPASTPVEALPLPFDLLRVDRN